MTRQGQNSSLSTRPQGIPALSARRSSQVTLACSVLSHLPSGQHRPSLLPYLLPSTSMKDPWNITSNNYETHFAHVLRVKHFVKCMKNHLHSILLVSNLHRGKVSLRKLCSMPRWHWYQSRIQIQEMLLQRPCFPPLHYAVSKALELVQVSVVGINMCPRVGAFCHGSRCPSPCNASPTLFCLRTLYRFLQAQIPVLPPESFPNSCRSFVFCVPMSLPPLSRSFWDALS